MERLIWGIMILILSGAGILSARLWRYQKQVRHILDELQMAEGSETNLLLTSAVSIGKTEAVISSINRILEKNRQKAERLNRENRSYRESIASISHDIRTPLTSAKGYMQMICNENVTEEKREEYARIVERRLDDLTGMLDQLFLYARVEAGELVFEKEELNVGNLFAETLSMFYEDFLKKNCEPEVFIDARPCHILADRQALVRVMENLIKNALVHGVGDYQFSLRQKGQQAAIQAANRTDSIEPGDIERIFDRFYTTDVSRSRKTTGLGLAIVKKFTEQMGGTAKAWLEGDVFFIEVEFPLYA